MGARRSPGALAEDCDCPAHRPALRLPKRWSARLRVRAQGRTGARACARRSRSAPPSSLTLRGKHTGGRTGRGRSKWGGEDAVNDCSQPTAGKNLRESRSRALAAVRLTRPRLRGAHARNLPSSAFQPGRQPLGKHARACERLSNSVRAGEERPAPRPFRQSAASRLWGAVRREVSRGWSLRCRR